MILQFPAESLGEQVFGIQLYHISYFVLKR